MEENNNLRFGLVLAGAMALILGVYWGFYYKGQTKPDGNTAVEKKLSLEWREVVSSAPFSPRDSHASFVFQNKIWVVGGLNGNGLVSPSHQVKYWQAPHFNDIWNSEDGLVWNKIEAGKIWPGRRSMNITEFNGALWMFGGWGPGTGYSNDLWRSEDGKNWIKVEARLPWEAREGQIAEIFDGKLWAMGGVNYDKRKTFNDVWYTKDGINWSLATSSAPWSPRWDFALAVFGGKFFLTGGMDIKDDEFNDVWSSEDGINWALVSEHAPWEARQGHSAISMEGKLFIMGRLNDEKHLGPNDIWYTEDGNSWKSLGELPWDGREDFSTVVLGGKIYVIGGMARDWTWRNDVWEGELRTR